MKLNKIIGSKKIISLASTTTAKPYPSKWVRLNGSNDTLNKSSKYKISKTVLEYSLKNLYPSPCFSATQQPVFNYAVDLRIELLMKPTFAEGEF